MASASWIQQLLPPGYVWAPGTVLLADHQQESSKAVLFPIPTADPNDPLNWTSRRKFLNYGICCSYVLWTFVQLDVGFTAWGPLMSELGISQFALNASVAANYFGLAFGCLMFIPFLYKFGRRPIYLFSVTIQLASCIWQGLVRTNGDIIGANLLSGLGGAISETVVQITIADLFFVHQHAEANAWYLIMTAIGAFLGPVASGYITDGQSWRWVWWYCTIFMAIQLFVSIFAFEESKYIPDLRSIAAETALPAATAVTSNDLNLSATQQSQADRLRPHLLRTVSKISTKIKPKTYRQRMALVTPTKAPFFRHFWQPIVILFTFPAILYTAITFGIILASFAIETSIQATYLLKPPYNFSASGVGLMNLPPFIGAILGFPFGGYLNDKSITWYARRNQGIYEPEMRLWMVLPFAILIPGGILMFGLGLAYGVHWSLLAVGYGLWGFGFIICSDVALAYCTDCYQDVVGDAFVGIAFSRNILSVAALLILDPLIDNLGLQNLHIVMASIIFVILLMPFVLMKHGKRARLWTMRRYREMALRQPTQRTF